MCIHMHNEGSASLLALSNVSESLLRTESPSWLGAWLHCATGGAFPKNNTTPSQSNDERSRRACRDRFETSWPIAKKSLALARCLPAPLLRKSRGYLGAEREAFIRRS